jgi:hypothetical protein
VPLWPLELIDGLSLAQLSCMSFIIYKARGWRMSATAFVIFDGIVLLIAHTFAYMTIKDFSL